MRHRFLIAVAAGVLSGGLCYSYQVRFNRGAGDISLALCSARMLLAGNDPYQLCQGLHTDGITPATANPLTTALAVSPLVPFSAETSAAIFIGFSSALLAFGLSSNGYWRLLALLAFPYWHALQIVQWSPLLFAVALYPVLLPLTLAKPHIGLPVALTRLTLRRTLACAAFGLISLAIMPDWPWRWIEHLYSPQEYLPPLLVLPFGPLLLLALLRWRDDRARFLLLMAVVPQRIFYDQFLLWLIPRSPREIMILSACSWLTYFGWSFFPNSGSTWVLALTYLPALILVLRPSGEKTVTQLAPVRGRSA